MATLGLIASGGGPTSYRIIVEYDGRPDHNFRKIANQISMFVLLLVGIKDKLVATRGCPGLSYLNTDKRAMDIPNIGL